MRGIILFVSAFLFLGSSCFCDEEASLYHDDPLVRHKRDDPPISQKYRIATILGEPYVMRSKQSNELTGFIPDLMKMISTTMGFTYDFILFDKYGSYQDGKWNGMIGGLIERQNGNTSAPDFAAADLTITAARRAVVDFAHPFKDIGLTVLIQKPHFDVKSGTFTRIDFDKFRFTVLSPLTVEVWALITLCVIAVALALWAFNKFNPYEWEGRFNLGLATKEEAESFSLPSSLWFVFSSLQWQGYDKSPRSWAGKILSIFWFIFVTITIITYMAGIVNNLFFASLVHERDPLFNRIHSLEELVQHPHGYSYGAIRGGSTHSYLKYVARGAEFDVIRSHLNSDEGSDDLVDSMEQALSKVRSEKYAFLLESTTAKYLTNRLPCDLMTVGEIFAKRNFGMAVPKGSTILERLDTEILKLRESGAIENLEEKWFGGMRNCWNVTLVENLVRRSLSLDVNRPKQIDMKVFWAPLVIIISGLVISSLVCVGESIWYKTRGRYSPSNRPQGQVLQADTDDVPGL